MDVDPKGVVAKPILLKGDTLSMDWMDEKKIHALARLSDSTFAIKPVFVTGPAKTPKGKIKIIGYNSTTAVLNSSLSWDIKKA